MTALVLIAVAVVVVAVAFVASARVVGEHEQLVILRLGRMDRDRVRGRGLAILLPIIDRGIRVDMRPRVYEIVGARMPTGDSEAVAVDATIRVRVTDPFTVTLNVADIDRAVPALVDSCLRKISAEASRSTLIAEPVRLRDRVLDAASEVFERWAVEVELDITDVRSVPPAS
jgi:regulator of protease activity HflC (stomatin/prohibitin superfamily)